MSCSMSAVRRRRARTRPDLGVAAAEGVAAAGEHAEVHAGGEVLAGRRQHDRPHVATASSSRTISGSSVQNSRIIELISSGRDMVRWATLSVTSTSKQ